MKKTIALVALAISFAGFYACQKNTTNPVTNTTNNVYITPTMSATVNGVPIVYVATINPGNTNWFQILGLSPNSGLTVNLPVPTDTITYQLAAGNGIPGLAFDSANNAFSNYKPIGASYIKITSFDKTTALFSGTFSATLQDSASGKKTVITNGKFSNF